jgi:hypothetical protein
MKVWEEPSTFDVKSIYEDTIHTITYKDQEHLYPILLSDKYQYEISISNQVGIACFGSTLPYCQRFIPLLLSGNEPNGQSADPDNKHDIRVNVYNEYNHNFDDMRFDVNKSNASALHDINTSNKPFMIAVKATETREKNTILLAMKKIVLTPFTLVADVFIDIIGIPLIFILDVPMGGGKPN